MKNLAYFFLSFTVMSVFHFAEGQQVNTPVDGQCNNDEIHTCITGLFREGPLTPTHHLWFCQGLNGGSVDDCSHERSEYEINESLRAEMESVEKLRVLHRIESPIVQRARASYTERKEDQELTVSDYSIENSTPEILQLFAITNEIDHIIDELCEWTGCSRGFRNFWYDAQENSIIEWAKQSYYDKQIPDEVIGEDDYFPEPFWRLILLTRDKDQIIQNWNGRNERFQPNLNRD